MSTQQSRSANNRGRNAYPTPNPSSDDWRRSPSPGRPAASSNGTLPPPPGPGPFPGSVELDKNGVVVGPGGKAPAHPHPPGRQKALTNGPKKPMQDSEFDEDEPEGDDYDDEDDYEEEDEEEDDEEEDVDVEDDVDIRNRTGHRTAPTRDRGRTNGKMNGNEDLFSLGASLTVTGK